MTELFRYECEVCGTHEYLTEKDAFDAGWDYPPFIGKWGIVSPRTCGNCNMTDTAWWALTQNLELTEKHRETLKRINAEVDTMDANEFVSALIKGIEATFELPLSLGEPVWGFLGLDEEKRGGVELRRDQLLEQKAFAVTRNGHPIAGVVQDDEGVFQAIKLDVEWAGNPEENPTRIYEEMFLEGM